MSRFEKIQHALTEGNNGQMAGLVQQALDEGNTPEEVLNEGLVAAMSIVGERFREHEIFLPDVLLSARAMYAGLEILKPLLGEDGAAKRGTIVIGTVEGDLHDIGKNLVGILLRGAGFEVIDLGNNVSADQFVKAVKEHEADVVGMSALLTTTMPAMERVVAQLEEAGLGHVKTMIGGAPLSDDFAAQIKASAYGYDAARAVDIAKGFLDEPKPARVDR